MTNQNKDKAKLTEKGDFYKTLIEMSPNAILVHHKGKFIFSNEAGINLLGGKTFEEIVKKPVIDYVHPDYRESVLKRIGNMENERMDAPPVVEKLIRLDGSVISANVFGKPIKYENLDANLLVVIDVTEELQNQENIIESENRKSAILKALPDLVFILDKNGVIKDYNLPEDGQLFVPRPNVIGSKIIDVLPKTVSDIYLSKIRDTLKTKSTNFFEFQLPYSYGVQTFEARFIYYEKNAVLVLIRNITKKKMVEEEQLRTMKFESIGLLAGGIAHDFNNTLMKILGNLHLAKLEENVSTNILNYLNEMEIATLQAKKLSNQLLTFSKGGEPLIQIASLKEIIENSISFYLSGSKSKVVEIYSDEQLAIEVDAGQIQQVISNLLLNADQSMPKGGVIEIKVDVVDVTKHNYPEIREGSYVAIAIIDHGCGISEENKRRIFEPYFTTKESGTGLGLTTSFSIIKRHRGYLDVQSELNKGSIFTVFLPYSGKKLNKEIKTVQSVFSAQGKVLVMDDSVEIQQILAKMLEHLGFTCELVNTGEQAILKYNQARKKDPFLFVIMDLTIPGGMGGLACLEEILKFDPNVKAIVSSGYSNDLIMARYHEYGFAGILPKPYSLDDLKKVISDVLK